MTAQSLQLCPACQQPRLTSPAGTCSVMLGNVDDLALLRQEFTAGDGSFLLRLRIDLHWDRPAFSRLEQAMRRVCA